MTPQGSSPPTIAIVGPRLRVSSSDMDGWLPPRRHRMPKIWSRVARNSPTPHLRRLSTTSHGRALTSTDDCTYAWLRRIVTDPARKSPPPSSLPTAQVGPATSCSDRVREERGRALATAATGSPLESPTLGDAGPRGENLLPQNEYIVLPCKH
jgi:hypothetical protein